MSTRPIVESRQRRGVQEPMSDATFSELFRERLHNQHVSGQQAPDPQRAVRSLLAVQSQDYVAGRWAVGQRVVGGKAALVDRQFADGAFLRTHVMRPTWHFVLPEDIRWLLQLTGPRVNGLCAHYYRKFAIDERVASRSRAVLVKALRGGKSLSRRALQEALRKARVLAPGDGPLRLVFLLLRAELDGLICSGPTDGSDFTYMLLEERVAPAPARTRDESLAEIARRYFTGHGPATVKDLAWWSGLTLRDVRAGVESVAGDLQCDVIAGLTYYRSARVPGAPRRSGAAHLIAAYDESLLSYRDSRVVFKPYAAQVTRDNGQVVVIDGRPVGSWRRRAQKTSIDVEVNLFGPVARREKTAIADAVDQYGTFHASPVSLRMKE